jgi:hypothetical protein
MFQISKEGCKEMSEQEEIDARIEKWHATPTNVGMAISSFGLVSGAVSLATHSPGGMILGAAAAWAAARHGDDVANAARNVASQVDAVVKALQGHNRAQPKDARDEDLSNTRTLSDNNLFDFDDDDEIDLPSQRKGKSNIFRFSELLASGFVPTVNKIFVGRRVDTGEDIFVAAKDLCHIAFAGKTGGGKGSLMRLIMAQLCYVGCKVLLLNPHYMRWVVADNGPEFDEDWSPFEGMHKRSGKPYLQQSPIDCADFPPIAQYLEWAVQTLLQDRKAAGREGGVRFKPYFIVLDEWPSIVDENKNAPGQLAKLLREGRKYGIFVIIASQDFQVKTIGMDGGSVRKCLLTVFYTGGDKTTGKELLNMQEKDLAENEIGKGVVYLRCVGTQNQPVLVRVPFVDNESVYRLLGPSTFKKASAYKVALPQPQQQKPVVQNGALTLDEAIRLVHEHPEIDPLVFMNRIADYQETDDLPEQETIEVVRSPYYEQSGSLRIDQVPTQVQPAYHKTVVHQDKDQAKIEKGVRLWNEGHNSVRKLEAASGWSNGETRRIIKLMEDRGLISRER